MYHMPYIIGVFILVGSLMAAACVVWRIRNKKKIISLKELPDGIYVVKSVEMLGMGFLHLTRRHEENKEVEVDVGLRFATRYVGTPEEVAAKIKADGDAKSFSPGQLVEKYIDAGGEPVLSVVSSGDDTVKL